MQVDTQVQRLPVPTDAERSRPAESTRTAGAPMDQQTVSLDAARTQKATENPEVKPTERDVEEVVQRLSDYVQNANRDLLFSVDEETGRTIIQVLDSKTKEVVRQIPPEEILALARHMVEREDTGGLLKVQV